jgi:hypothetical protein
MLAAGIKGFEIAGLSQRHSRRFIQLFKKFFQVEQGKYFLYTSNKRVPYGFYTNMFSSVRRETIGGTNSRQMALASDAV